MRRDTPNDPAPVKLAPAAWLAALRSAWDDADAAAQDMLRRPRKRKLGPAEHRKLYRDAAETVEHLLDNPPDDGAPTDPDATPTGELDAHEPPGAPGGGS